MSDIDGLKSRLVDSGKDSLEYRSYLVICGLERGGVGLSDSAAIVSVKEELLLRTGEGDQLASRALSAIVKLERACSEEEVERELKQQEAEDYLGMEAEDEEEDLDEEIDADELDDFESFHAS
jgi:hypothetical protein